MKLIIISAMLVMSVGAFADNNLGQNSESVSAGSTCVGCEKARQARMNQDEQRKNLAEGKKATKGAKASTSSSQ